MSPKIFKTLQNLANAGFTQLSGQTLSLSGVTIIGNSGKFSYAVDLHSTYTARSIVDASYVTGQTAIIRNIGSNQQIIYRDTGGITGATHFLYNKTLPSLSFGSNNCAHAIDSAVIGGRNNIITSGNTGSTIFGGSDIILSAATYCRTVVVPNLVIWETPQGSGTLLGWNPVTKKVYLTSSSGGTGGGDKNNVYSKTIISGSTGLTSGSTYVILVSGSTSITITLPTNPLDGQAFKIKDAYGNALTNNIIINAGAGRTIDGSQCATINTNYGAVQLMLGTTCKWFTLGFLN
jgi:hypothetical protein